MTDLKSLPDLGAPIHHAADGVHIDVRGMTAPGPMLAILRLCAAVPAGADIIVHHERDPIYLYPELAELGWDVTPLPWPAWQAPRALSSLPDGWAGNFGSI